MPPRRLDAIVIGGGPNGLSAAITLAAAGRAVRLYEAADRVGGGVRSSELTRPGFVHDLCSAVFPLGVSSPVFSSLPLAQYGLEWVHSPLALAHPLDGGAAVVLGRSVEETAAGLGSDGAAWARVAGGLARRWARLRDDVLAPLHVPRHPWALARFGLEAIQPARRAAMRLFAHEPARALFAGLAAHSMLPLERPVSAAIGLVLGALAHVGGWPVARGGAQRLADALAAHLAALGGEIVTGTLVTALADLPPAGCVLCDVTPRQLLALAGDRLPGGYRRQLARYRYGLGVFKVDWALAGPIPWAAPACGRAATVHVGGALGEIAEAEAAPWHGRIPDRPFVLLAQPSLFDSSRAPAGQHTAWAYCHVPAGATVDMTGRLERQVERFAPGFGARILARHVMAPADLERRNPNLVGGDIGAGVLDLAQLFRRPTWRTCRTPVRGLYLCSAATPPGGGVHGLCGYYAARAALRDGH
jgi:phytoene dehydrogenase-like protein